MPAYDRTLDLRYFLKAVLQLFHICLGLTAYLHSPIQIWSYMYIVPVKLFCKSRMVGSFVLHIISHLTPKKQDVVKNLVCILNLS